MQTKTMKYTIVFFALTGILHCGCKSKPAGQEMQQSSDIPENSVMLTGDQIRMANLVTGKITRELISETVECSGSIEVPSNSIATVSAPVGGFIKNAPYYPGNTVRKGTVLVVLEHPDYIKLQQDYLETRNRIEYVKEEFKRQGELTVENASSIKKMQQAQSDYRVEEVRLLSLSAQLKLLDINPDSLDVEGIKTTISIKAPISGTISKVNASIGKFAAPNEMIYEIVNDRDTHLHLDIYEKDIHKVKKGQQLNFWLVNEPGKKYCSEVITIGPMVDPETRTFGVHAHIHDNTGMLRPGMFIFAEIFISSDSVFAAPADAIVLSEGKEYIFEVNDTVFTRVQVETGVRNNRFVQLVHLPEEIAEHNIVASGAYYVNAEMNKEE